jgi:hypothetical protein
MKQWKSVLAFLLAVILVLPTAAFAAGNKEDDGLPFHDVSDSAWYAQAVAFAFEKGLMTGTGGALFSPEATLTRAQLVTML